MKFQCGPGKCPEEVRALGLRFQACGYPAPLLNTYPAPPVKIFAELSGDRRRSGGKQRRGAEARLGHAKDDEPCPSHWSAANQAIHGPTILSKFVMSSDGDREIKNSDGCLRRCHFLGVGPHRTEQKRKRDSDGAECPLQEAAHFTVLVRFTPRFSFCLLSREFC